MNGWVQMFSLFAFICAMQGSKGTFWIVEALIFAILAGLWYKDDK